MKEKLNLLINLKFFNNFLIDYVILFLIIFFGIILLKIIKKVIFKRMQIWSDGTKTKIDDFVILSIEKTFFPIAYYGLFFIGSKNLKLNKAVNEVISASGIILFSILGILLISRLLNYFINNYNLKNEKVSIPRGIITLSKSAVWVFGLIFLLDNLGFNVKTIIAGLGIGGVAIAMASQTILKDLFNYFVILFDRPFENGDFIVFGDHMGNVEKIGIKTTRLRSSGGEEIIISNSDLAEIMVSNFKRMNKRTVKFTIGVAADTPVSKLKEIPTLIKNIISKIQDAEFNRAHFREIGDYSHNYEIQYYVHTTNYIRNMEIREEINLRLIEELDNLNIKMPYPTQVVLAGKE